MSTPQGQQPGVWRYVTSPAVLKRNLTIALVVGCLLSVANQWDVLMREPMGMRTGIKIFLNFLIPFAVSSLSAVINRSGPPTGPGQGGSKKLP